MSRNTSLQVDHNFSVYNTVMRSRPLNIFSDNRRMLARWSANIEHAIIEGSFNITIFVGFQQLEYFLPVLDRYKQMATIAEKIYIFGQPHPDTPYINNLEYVYLKPDDQLCKEWFLVINHPTYTRSLVALETSEIGTPHSNRTFTGILTSDPEIISPTYQHLINQVSKSHTEL